MITPLISIVTVCFNSIKTLPITVASIREQTFQDFEWIVIDGLSTDGTIEYLQQQSEMISTFISEKDGGIYDAMNKAVRLAKGQWIYFLNSDDYFCDGNVLADVAVELTQAPKNIGVCYGDAIYKNNEYEWLRSFHWVTKSNILYGDLCHQVVFARKSLFSGIGLFNDSLRYNADFDWLVRAAKADVGFYHFKRSIVVFFKGGAHVINGDLCEKERFDVRYHYQQPFVWRFRNVILRTELKLRRLFGEAV